MQDGGVCEIIGYIEENGEQRNLCFIVRDNGKGISEKAQQLIWSNDSEEGLYSFGLKNVRDRIQLRFGDSYGIFLSSKLGHGVEVQVRLPLIMKVSEQQEGDN